MLSTLNYRFDGSPPAPSAAQGPSSTSRPLTHVLEVSAYTITQITTITNANTNEDTGFIIVHHPHPTWPPMALRWSANKKTVKSLKMRFDFGDHTQTRIPASSSLIILTPRGRRWPCAGPRKIKRSNEILATDAAAVSRSRGHFSHSHPLTFLSFATTASDCRSISSSRGKLPCGWGGDAMDAP